MREFDLCIVGAGAAGLSAAVYAARKELSVCVLDKNSAGGQTAKAIWIENYPGFGKIKGNELMQKMLEQAKSFGIEIIENATVKEIKKTITGFETIAEKETIFSKAVLLCTGTTHKKLNVPGEKELYGRGVSYCATCDGPFFRKQRVAVIGGGNSGMTAALLFAEIAAETFLVEFLPDCKCDEIYKEAIKKTKVKIFANTMVTEILGKEKVEGIKIKNRSTQKEETIAVDGVFIYVGLMPQNELAKKISARLNEKGFVAVNAKLETSVQGLFAAGDITGNLAQTVWAAAEGAKAALNAYDFIKER